MIDYLLPSPLPWDELASPMAAAEQALARLDERLRHSPIREGWIARQHFADAAASLWLAGDLVHPEDLVLRDADMGVGVPTAELNEACTILRARRLLSTEALGWSLSSEGFDRLRGRSRAATGEPRAGVGPQPVAASAGSVPTGRAGGNSHLADREDMSLPPTDGRGAIAEQELLAAMQRADAVLARSTLALSTPLEGIPPQASAASRGGQATPQPGAPPRGGTPPRGERSPLVYDPDWDEESDLTKWRRVIAATEPLPPTLQAAVALDAWDTIEPLQRQPWMGRLIMADMLRQRGKLGMLPGLSAGLKTITRERRRAKDPTTRLLAGLEGIAAMAGAGLKDHQRWATAHDVLKLKLRERRTTSRLPDLVDLVMRSPLITTGLVAKELRISSRSAQTLIAELGLRELTGRGRYRAWGIL